MNAAGTQCEQDADYYPYGGVENDNCTTPVAQNYKFTGKERDSESGLDNFGARYNASSLGRFMSVDPIWVKADRIVDPQRLNLYAYGRNNPLKFKDPTGMDLKMGNCPSNMTVSMCEAAVTNSLKKEDRNHVHFVEGTGKNGLAKGEVLIQADKDYKSGSTNFTRLQGLVNDHSGVGVLNVESPTGAFPMVTVTGWSSKNGTTYANGTSTLGHLTDVDAFHGSTLFPLASSAWSLLGRYTPLPWTEVYVNSEDSAVELAVDVAHELVHVKLGDFGKNPGAAAHESPGHPNPELENQIREAEDEARANAQQ
jgi:RHS repeat-associated protein